MAQVRAGDETAYAEFVRRHHGRIMALCVSMLGGQSEAEDAAQEAFPKAYRSLKDFCGDCAFSTWLYRTEAFVARVMGRIEESKDSRWSWVLSPRWLVPALAGLAAASLLAVPGLRAVPDPAEMMIQEQKGGTSFLSTSASSTHDEVLAFVQGER